MISQHPISNHPGFLPRKYSKVLSPVSAAYRWSADGNGRRKRESLLDNIEPAGLYNDKEDRLTRLRRRREERRRQRGEDRSDTPEDLTGRPHPAAETDWDATEWGPVETAPPEDTEWGWAEESWGSNRSPASYRSERMAWDEDFQRQEGRRRRSAAGASTSYERGFRGLEEIKEEEDEYSDGTEADEYSEGPRSNRYVPGDNAEPDIALLSPQELERVLPVVPFSAQASYFTGGAAQAVQRWSASLALTILLSKAALLAAGALTWPLWWPWAQAAGKNYSVRKQKSCAGLWRTQVLEMETSGRPRVRFGLNADDENGPSRASRPRFTTMRTTRIVLGDPNGAKTEFALPHDARFDLVEPGQPAELIVLADSPAFESFKAVKDVYLPECGLWISEYPYLDRNEFLEISLEIEREAAVAAEAAGQSRSFGGTDAAYASSSRLPPRY